MLPGDVLSRKELGVGEKPLPEFLFDALGDGDLYLRELKKIAIDAGWSHNSVAAALDGLRKQKRVIRHGRALWGRVR